jgi:hypothetical protein
VGAFAALLAALVLYYTLRERLPNLSLWHDLIFLAAVLMPAVFLLVWLALPLRLAVGLFPIGLALGVLAAVCDRAGLGTVGNFAKLGAATAIGFWFLTYFETVSWVVLIACIVPWVDAYSVWRGPTHRIVTKHQDVFGALSFAFPIFRRGTAHLGLPDLLFFALFLAAAARFALRPWWTWVGLAAGISATILLASAFDVGGLPALPLLSLGFLLPNADVLWRRLRAPA